MSLKLQFAALSMGASVDQQTGSLSVFDVVEELRVPQLPIQLQSLVISISLEKTIPGDFSGKLMIHLLLPDGKQQMVGNGDLRVPAEQRRMKAVFRYGGFPVHAWGKHRFVISWLDQANKKVGEAILDFDAIQVQQAAQGVAPDGQNPSVAH